MLFSVHCACIHKSLFFLPQGLARRKACQLPCQLLHSRSKEREYATWDPEVNRKYVKARQELEFSSYLSPSALKYSQQQRPTSSSRPKCLPPEFCHNWARFSPSAFITFASKTDCHWKCRLWIQIHVSHIIWNINSIASRNKCYSEQRSRRVGQGVISHPVMTSPLNPSISSQSCCAFLPLPFIFP